eukprot:c15207_g1_i1.p1 GENE.c15207_g1_i1~~c15207_g1_i1.p1  ORF type:complete len:293 (+),score=42.54 c15207_g1_i1:175-1053(+)
MFAFEGRRFQCPGHPQGRFKAYVDFVERIATQCGFEVHVDRLRIPSVKNIALVGYPKPKDHDSSESLITANQTPTSSAVHLTSRNRESAREAALNGIHNQHALALNVFAAALAWGYGEYLASQDCQHIPHDSLSCNGVRVRVLWEVVQKSLAKRGALSRFAAVIAAIQPLQGDAANTLIWVGPGSTHPINGTPAIPVPDMMELLSLPTMSTTQPLRSIAGGFKSFVRAFNQVFELLTNTSQPRLVLQLVPWGNSPSYSSLAEEGGRKRYRTKGCFYHRYGLCPKGDECTFLH